MNSWPTDYESVALPLRYTSSQYITILLQIIAFVKGFMNMNLCDVSVVKRLMSKYQTGTKKSFGQNFLINKDVPYSIASESISYHRQVCGGKKSAVIEIGPGIGSLTSELCQVYDKVFAIEIDKALIPILAETLAEYDNVSVINEDFLKINLDEFIEKNLGDG